jgi:REP element-mobilizing transposase RayT
MTSQMTVKVPIRVAAPHPGSAGASPAVSGASPETVEDISYAKRRLPHFERPWSKYAVVFSTHERHTLRPAERDIVLQSILYASDQDQYELYVAWVMPDHVHLLFEPQLRDVDSMGRTRFWSLAKILQGIKSTSSHRINRLRQVSGTVLEGEPFDRLIRSERDLQEKFRYICRNPWEAGIVTPAEDYHWLWTPDLCPARAPNTAGEAPALPGAGKSANAAGGA